MLYSRDRTLRIFTCMMLLSGLLFFTLSTTRGEAHTFGFTRGEGRAFLKGARITNLSYKVSLADPSIVSHLKFNIENTRNLINIRVSLREGGVWYPCDIIRCSHGWQANCDLTGDSRITVAEMDALRVITIE